MIPINRYLRDRNERMEREDKKWDDPIKKKPSKQDQESLGKIEKSKKIKFRPLPKGGIRNLDYKGPLPEKELDRLEELYPLYKKAEKITGVNWRILAAIHYRESSLGLDLQAKGNEFQFDGVLKSRATGVFEKDVLEAGKILQEKAKLAKVDPLSFDQIDGENIREALFYYNGTIYKRADRSPYVLNQLDSKHLNMPIFLGANADPQWGVDSRLGAIPFAKELEKAFPTL